MYRNAKKRSILRLGLNLVTEREKKVKSIIITEMMIITALFNSIYINVWT